MKWWIDDLEALAATTSEVMDSDEEDIDALEALADEVEEEEEDLGDILNI